MSTRRRPTLETVAASAGVARGTVSRVINGAPDVAPDLRERVLRAISEVGYVPNSAARALVTGRSGMVAIVVGETTERLFSDPFYSQVMLGIMGGLTPHRLHQILMMLDSPIAQADIEGYLLSGHVDGVLFLSQHGDDPLPPKLARAAIPYVLGGRPLTYPSDPDAPFVDFDNVRCAHTAVTRLLEIGKKNIATITGPLDTSVGGARLQGYKDCMRAAGISVQPVQIAEGDFTAAGGARMMATLLQIYPQIDGVFTANDMMAIGALETLYSQGRGVPDPVAVVSIDDNSAASHSHPPLTTVRQDHIEMGRQMAAMLAAIIAGHEGPRQIILDSELVIRESA